MKLLHFNPMMAQLEMYCNFAKCRRSLNKVAWVTSCSHAFCEDHGQHEFIDNQEQPSFCPACRIPLGKKFDIVKVDLDPSEDFKSMVLAGLRPEIISDILNRALTFWNYQICQEHLYQVVSSKKSKENLENMEKYFDSAEKKNRAQLESCERALHNAQAEISALQQKAEDLVCRLNAKTQQNNKIQQMYDASRLSTLTSNMRNTHDSPNLQTKRQRVQQFPFIKPHTPNNFRQSSDFPHRQPYSEERSRRRQSEDLHFWPPDKGFVFRPVTPDGGYATNVSNASNVTAAPPLPSHSKRTRFDRPRNTPANF